VLLGLDEGAVHVEHDCGEVIRHLTCGFPYSDVSWVHDGYTSGLIVDRISAITARVASSSSGFSWASTR
jgi:hypothetical protein